MKYYIRGKNDILELNQNDFVTQGGEGKIYRKNGFAYKIYHKKTDVPPDAKIAEITAVKSSNIIKPLEVILNTNGDRVGYSTLWVDGIPLCKLFVTGYRVRNKIGDEIILKLIKKMQETILEIHTKNILLVDLNEQNFIVNNDFIIPYFIDVMCWQTKSYPATVIMPSIRDWLSQKFTEMTDWFSYSILCAYLFTGIHPFKGKHDYYDTKFHDPIERLKHRVIDGISIFNKDVRIPANVNINSIPSNYKDWFIHLFEHKQRIPPPLSDAVINIIPSVIQQFSIDIDKLVVEIFKSMSNNEPVLYFNTVNNFDICKTSMALYIGDNKVELNNRTAQLLFTPITNTPVYVKKQYNKIILECPNSTLTRFEFVSDDFMIIDNKLFIKDFSKLSEIQLIELNNRIIPTINRTLSIMPYASVMYRGVVLQNMLGKIYAVFPDVAGNEVSFVIRPIKELDNVKVIDAKYENHILAVHILQNTEYKTFVIRFNNDFNTYDMKQYVCDDICEINMVVLDNGIVLLIPTDGQLVFFSNNIKSNVFKTISDNNITNDMKLFKSGTTALLAKNNELYKISIKK